MGKYKTCPKCGKYRRMSQHHIFPRRWLKHDSTLPNEIYELCRKCHDRLEDIIDDAEFGTMPFRSRKSNTFYIEVVEKFVGQKIYF